MNREEREAFETLELNEVDDYDKEKRIILKLVKKQEIQIKQLSLRELDFLTIYNSGLYDGQKKIKDRIRELLKNKGGNHYISKNDLGELLNKEC